MYIRKPASALNQLAFGEEFSQRGAFLDEAGLRRRYEDVVDALSCLRRALHVIDGTDGARHLVSLFGGHGLQLLSVSAVRPEIFLETNKNNGNMRTEVTDLRLPLVPNVLKTDGVADAEANENDVCIRIRQRPTNKHTRNTSFQLNLYNLLISNNMKD